VRARGFVVATNRNSARKLICAQIPSDFRDAMRGNSDSVAGIAVPALFTYPAVN
jgi:hypothetical protein